MAEKEIIVDESKIQETQDARALEIMRELGGEPTGSPQQTTIEDEDENEEKDATSLEDDSLPSDKEEEEEEEPKKKETEALFAGKYKTVDELKKGITNLKSTLPQYVLDGMNDDALEKHYKELKTAFDNRKKPDDKKAEDKKDGSETAKLSDLWKEAKAEFRNSSTISDDLYGRLENAGMDSDMINEYIDKLDYEQKEFTRNVYEIAGGQDEFLKIKEWAEDGNIPQSQLDSMQNMSYDAIILAMRGIKAVYDSKNNTKKEPTRVSGKVATSSGSQYTSQQAYIKDVADPRYGKNKSYTEKVDAKFANSKALN